MKTPLSVAKPYKAKLIGLILLVAVVPRLVLAQDTKPPDPQPPAEEVEPLDPWAPITPDETTNSTIRTTNKVGEREAPKTTASEEEDAVEEEVIEIKAMVTEEPGPTKVDPNEQLQKALTPEATELSKKELKRFEAAEKARAEVAKEQAAKLGLTKKSNLDPRGLPEVTICSINANNYGNKEIWEATFRRSDIPKRTVIRRSIIKAIKEASCDLIAVQNVLGKDDADAILSLQELLGYKEEEQAGWKIILGAVNREVSRNAILYRDRLKVHATEKFSGARLKSFGSFRLDQLGIPPVQATFDIPRAEHGPVRKLALTSFTLKNAATFSSDETEIKRIQAAEFIRSKSAAIKRSESDADTIVVLAGNRAGSADSIGTKIMEGRYKLADFLSDGACFFDTDGTVQCLPEKIRPKEYFGIVSSSPPELYADVLSSMKIKHPKMGKKGKKAQLDNSSKINLLASEIYMDGVDYYLGLSKAGAPGKFDLRIIPVRSGLPESPFLALKLNW